VLCGRDAVQIRPPANGALDLESLAGRLAAVGTVRHNAHLVRLALDRYELTIFRDGRAIVKGTGDPAVARGLYARYVGV
jgi:adenylyltransferase/sulfurtransferase